MMSIKCLELRLEDGLGEGWQGAHNAVRCVAPRASNELLSSEMFIAPRFWGEKSQYSPAFCYSWIITILIVPTYLSNFPPTCDINPIGFMSKQDGSLI